MITSRLRGLRTPGGWPALLIVALATDMLVALLAGADEIGQFLRGDWTSRSVIEVLGVVWQVLILAAATVVIAALATTQRTLFGRQQALDAVGLTSQEWMWETDVTGVITYCSPSVQDVLGYQPRDLTGRSDRTLIHPDDLHTLQRLREQAVRGSGGWNATELRWLHADGTPVVMRGASLAIVDERGRVVGFRGSRRLVTARDLAQRSLEAARYRVQAVVDDKALDVALQPIVDLTSGRLCGAEALSRFRDGRSPDEWFADAAASGLALELDRVAFHQALQTLRWLPDPCYLSVNTTPELLATPAFTAELLSRDLPLNRLVIEITEHSRVTDYDALRNALTPLRERGVRLAVDDTGAGYASLTHVLKLRPSIIKIDRSLITNITSDPARRSLVTALVLLALDLGASITGEGIETAMELETLTSLGVDAGQGYLLARPSTDPGSWLRWARRNWLHPDGTYPQDRPTRDVRTRHPNH